MSKFKRIVALTACILIAGGIATGCNSDNKTSDTEYVKDEETKPQYESKMEITTEETLPEKETLYGKEIKSGKFSENTNWAYYENGVLVLSGEGEIEFDGDYGAYATVPWYEYCEDITKVVFEEGIINVPNDLFYSGQGAVFKYELSEIEFADSIIKIGNGAFQGAVSFSTLEIPEGVEEIGEGAFSSCDMTKLIIPDGLEVIEVSAFSYCSNLEFVDFGDDLTTIRDYAFTGCRSLKTLEFGDKLTLISDNAFESCQSLESVDFGSGLTEIGNGAFDHCNSLTEITIPGTVKIINGFFECEGLQTVIIEPGAEVIEDLAFYGCINLSTVILPDGLLEINREAFNECPNLESIDIPASIEYIGNEAFTYGIDEVYIYNPECKFPQRVNSDDKDWYAFSKSTVIHGYAGSTAEAYAEEFEYDFVVIE